MKKRTTSINIEQKTEEWLKNKGMKATFALNNAPEWHERLTQQETEIIELRKFREENQGKMIKLQTENIDLLRFRIKVIEEMKNKARE
jgi:hypothetical protein